MDFYNKPAEMSAFNAKFEAQKIVFAPVAFQVARCLLKFGILKAVDEAGKKGVSLVTLTQQLDTSEYGISVLLDMGLNMGLVWQQDDNFILDKAIETGKPEGLKVFGDWQTIYPGLSQLPEEAKRSWFEFDHYYSDHAFPEVLALLFEHNPKHILDVGGNTGKWSLACTKHDAEINVTIMDLPGQLNVALANAKEAGVADRVHGLGHTLLSCKKK